MAVRPVSRHEGGGGRKQDQRRTSHAQGLGHLQARNRDAAGALQQDDLVAPRHGLPDGLEAVEGHPGRDGGDGQAGGLVGFHVVGNAHEPVRREDAVLGEAARQRQPQPMGHVLLPDLPADVPLVERRHDPVALLPRRVAAAAHLDHRPADVGARHHAPVLPDRLVVAVEAHADYRRAPLVLARPALPQAAVGRAQITFSVPEV